MGAQKEYKGVLRGGAVRSVVSKPGTVILRSAVFRKFTFMGRRLFIQLRDHTDVERIVATALLVQTSCAAGKLVVNVGSKGRFAGQGKKTNRSISCTKPIGHVRSSIMNDNLRGKIGIKLPLTKIYHAERIPHSFCFNY